MRRIGRHRQRREKQKKILIIGSLSLLLFLCAGYAAFSTNLSITAKGNIKEKSRVIQSWDDTLQTDFHSDFYKEHVVSATFLDNNNVPDNATESWNVSEDKENGGVMAWVVPSNSDNTKYDLYIGAPAGVIANEDSGYLFYNFKNVEIINFNNSYDTGRATTLEGMFQFCLSLKELDLSTFDTSNVTEMGNLFCMFDNSSGTVLENNLTKIVFGENFSVEKVRSLSQMFAGCNKLLSIDVSNWDTSNIADMSSVFAYCSSLIELDLSSWNTENVILMPWMFIHCDNVTDINLCNFNTNKVTTMNSMFSYTQNLKQVKVGINWSTNNVDTEFMFEGSAIYSVTTGQC